MLTPRRCGVLGHPVAHSLSPLLHRTAYGSLGLDWTYDAYDVTEETLPAFVAGLDDTWRGLSLTMPLKRAVLPLLDGADNLVVAVQAANTVLRNDDGRLVGANTDVPGMVGALRAGGVDEPVGAVVVLGGGATAAAALVAARTLGARTALLRVRDAARAQDTVRVGTALGLDVTTAALDDPWPEEVLLLVATVPADAVQVPDHALRGVVLDVRYDPWPSTLLVRAEAAGGRTATGLDLLAHQAAGQVELMCGRPVDPDVLRAAALRAVGG